jgi:hypothetical protein
MSFLKQLVAQSRTTTTTSGSLAREVKGASKPRKSKTVRVKAHRRHPAGTAPADLIIANGKVVKLESEIANLKHQIVGFRAVISYLEDLSGLRNSQ